MKDMKIEANRWWRQARSDFAFLPKIQEMGKYDTGCFLAQQTVEKALKAYLFFQGEELIFTHSIFKLCEMASKHEQQFLALREDVKQLISILLEPDIPMPSRMSYRRIFIMKRMPPALSR